ncbi:MAG: beta-galactosidase [Phycisphaeraceae bacterium]
MEVTRKIRNGSPELSLDGSRPSPGFGRLMQPNYWAVEKLDQFFRPDYNLFYVQIGELDTFGWCWDGLDGYDYTQFDILLDQLLQKKPDSRFNLFLGGRVPYQWQLRYPGEMVLLESGKRTNIASPSSPVWLEDSTEAVRRFVEHFESGPYADAVAGYNPIYFTNEWLLGGLHSDYNESNVQRFRDWLRDYYGGDVEKLRDAWKDPKASFETAEIPRMRDYEAQGLGGVFDRHEIFGSWAADYLRFFNQSVSNMVLRHAGAVKEASNRKKFVSLMFGYTYCYVMGQMSPAHSSHWDLSSVLESDDVDMLHSPYDYYNRCLGGPHYSQLSPDSVIAHGKVFATQIDTKTHVHTMDPGNAATPWESDQVLKRDVANAMMRNAYHYYYEMNVPAWRGRTGTVEYRELGFIDEGVQDTIVKLRDIADANHAELPERNAEVALFTSRESAYYRAFHPAYATLFDQAFRNYFLCYTGAPFHDYLLEDFETVDRDYKVYIFPDASYLSERQRQAIREKLDRIGATAVWFYAPGYASDSGTGVENMEAATGIRFAKRDLRDYLQVDIGRFDHPLTQGLENEASFGSDLSPEWFQAKQEWLDWKLKDRADYKFSPFFVVDDPDATPLGTLRGAREPGFAVKQVGNMKSVYLAGPCPSPELMMNIFRDAGVHLYSDTPDIIYANARYVTFCVNGAGRKVLRLPEKVDLYEALEQKLLAKNADHYEFDAAEKQVEVFQLGQPPQA